MTVRAITGLNPVSPPSYWEWFDLSSRPLLKLALENASPAHSVRIEWLVDQREPDGTYSMRCLTNYTQILRTPFSSGMKEDGTLETFAEATKRAGELHLDDIEKTLWFGKPRYDFGSSLNLPISMCGGVYHYLRRRVYENDVVRLRPLQELMLRDFRQFDSVGAEGEWLTEFSLQVNPGHYQRGMKPMALPPTDKTLPRAWAQGASLEV